jgi:hypothetical protein
MNNLPLSLVLPGMRIHRQNGLPGPPAGFEDHTTDTPAKRHHWPRRLGRRERPPRANSGGDDVQAVAADAMQLAVGLLTASLDSPELEAWAVRSLIPEDPTALGDCIAGLHVVARLLLQELQNATGQPPAVTLQELAILAESRRETPPTA